jgi:hypothetical protein
VPLRFEAPGTRLDGLMIAFDPDAAVGMCQLTCPAGPALGVHRDDRSPATLPRSWAGDGDEAASLAGGQVLGCSEVRTFHNPKNLAIIAANRSLGFREADFDL